MSASLVGSEMCIRDRLGGELAETASVEEPQSDRAALLQTTACAVGSDAVSYTHLTLPTICSV
eukprot:2889522-Alexandrium_andersonii.AAC.1